MTHLRKAFEASPYATQVQLAEASGLHKDTICNVLNKDQRPTITTARKLARALAVSVRFIYEGEGG